MAEYWTNDTESKYFTDKYIADLCTPDDKWYKEYFSKKEDMFKWFKEISGHNVKSVEEILAVTEKWDSQNPDDFCNIYEFSVSD